MNNRYHFPLMSGNLAVAFNGVINQPHDVQLPSDNEQNIALLKGLFPNLARFNDILLTFRTEHNYRTVEELLSKLPENVDSDDVDFEDEGYADVSKYHDIAETLYLIAFLDSFGDQYATMRGKDDTRTAYVEQCQNHAMQSILLGTQALNVHFQKYRDTPDNIGKTVHEQLRPMFNALEEVLVPWRRELYQRDFSATQVCDLFQVVFDLQKKLTEMCMVYNSAESHYIF